MPVTKKAPVKKAVATKKPAPPKKAAPKPETNGKEENAARIAELRATIMEMHEGGKSFKEISEELQVNPVTVHSHFVHASTPRINEKPSPARVKARRDAGLAWTPLAAMYGLTKAQVQKLYREAGGDPQASYIGKGGRYFEHEDKITRPTKAAPKKPAPGKKITTTTAKTTAPRAKKATPTKAPAAKKATKRPSPPAGDKQFFADDTPADEIRRRIAGKTLTYRMSEHVGGMLKEVQVMSAFDRIKVGTSPSGERSVAFHDGNGSKTVAIAAITKVSR